MQSFRKMRQAIAATSLIFVSASVAAVPITTLFSTGVDDTGAPLPIGASEQHYEVTTAHPNIFTPKVTSHGAYMPNTASSAWISLTSGHSSATYETTFDLTGYDVSSASLDLNIAVDNSITDVLINGVSTGFAITFGYPAFQSWSNLVISSDFVAGVNTLQFLAVNSGGPGAFRVQASGDATAVSEPGVVVLFSLGLIGLAMTRRSKAKN